MEQNQKILIIAAAVILISLVSFNFEEITGANVRTTVLPKITVSSIGHDNPEMEPTLIGRTKIFLILDNVLPTQQFEFYRVDQAKDSRVGQFAINSRMCTKTLTQTSNTRYKCLHEELLPKDTRWETGRYYVQAKARENDPNGKYKIGQLIGEKTYFKYQK